MREPIAMLNFEDVVTVCICIWSDTCTRRSGKLGTGPATEDGVWEQACVVRSKVTRHAQRTCRQKPSGEGRPGNEAKVYVASSVQCQKASVLCVPELVAVGAGIPGTTYGCSC